MGFGLSSLVDVTISRSAPGQPSFDSAVQYAVKWELGILQSRLGVSLVDDAPSERNRDDLQTRLAQFRFSLRLFDRNYEHFVLFIRYFTDPRVSFSFSPVEQHWLQQEGVEEALFRLHDFVASALALVDHTRVIHRQLYDEQGLMADYQGEIDRRFTDNSLTQFVLGLRHMCQHYRLPSLNLQTELTSIGRAGQAKAEITLALRKDDLLGFSGWNARAKSFVEDAPDRIELLSVTDSYYRQVTEFNAWFRKKQREIHGVSPELYERSLRHGDRYQDRPELAEVENNLQALELRSSEPLTFHDLQRVLDPVLTILDLAKLQLCQHDAPLWVDTALRSVERNFVVPPSLRGRLLELFSGSDP